MIPPGGCTVLVRRRTNLGGADPTCSVARVAAVYFTEMAESGRPPSGECGTVGFSLPLAVKIAAG